MLYHAPISGVVVKWYVLLVQMPLPYVSVVLMLHQYLVSYWFMFVVFVVDAFPSPDVIVPFSRVCQVPEALVFIHQSI